MSMVPQNVVPVRPSGVPAVGVVGAEDPRAALILPDGVVLRIDDHGDGPGTAGFLVELANACLAAADMFLPVGEDAGREVAEVRERLRWVGAAVLVARLRVASVRARLRRNGGR
ncbi:hypothetical protein ACG83_04740 [Frankia sp. R43]|uniref:hypothetical protein n=1 Tax=Frankia sp. R43 TaxID=269536 RepID=UPI0006CA0B52|nr:hypothetical protein [Frankia sp. R43]KPM50456.1 hypothetical protein ACG83_39745 [Frankia sp. R43]KPM57090.1 hypothetical protein ACG83_04740 [Frankia sp. R43]